MTTIHFHAVLLGLFLTPSPILVNEQQPKNDPEAVRRLEDLAGAYRAAVSYADHGEFVLETKIAGVTQTQRSPLRLSFARPNKLNFENGLTRVVSDGKTLTTVVDPLKRYSSAPAPESLRFDALFRAGPVASTVFGGPSGPAMKILLSLAFAADPVKAFSEFSDGLSIAPDVSVDGKTFKVLNVKLQRGTASILSDPKSNLVQTIEISLRTKGLAETLPRSLDVSLATYRWNAGVISTEPLDAKVFEFTPPQDFGKVDTLVNAAGNIEAGPRYKVQGLIGRPAPAFTLTVLDGPEKTRTLTKADLAGKVVLIDFWATWCGPCLAELPQIQELIQGYARANKDVVIVALSEDNASPDPLEIRKLVEKKLSEQKLVLTGTSVGKIGLDPSGSVGEAFEVEGFPTVVVLDGQGIVRATHVGFAPEIGKSLTKEIEVLLGKK